LLGAALTGVALGSVGGSVRAAKTDVSSPDA